MKASHRSRGSRLTLALILSLAPLAALAGCEEKKADPPDAQNVEPSPKAATPPVATATATATTTAIVAPTAATAEATTAGDAGHATDKVAGDAGHGIDKGDAGKDAAKK